MQMGMSIFLSVIERITFGRTISFVTQAAISTIPLIFAAALGSPSKFFASLSIQSLLILSLFGLATSSVLSYVLLKKVGKSTYSPKLHNKKYILSSVFLLLLLGFLSTYIGYLLLVYPFVGEILPKKNDILVGLFLSSLYLIALSSAVVISVWSRPRKKEKEQLVTEFLSTASELSEADLNEAGELADKLESVCDQLLEKTKKEPMKDGEHISQELQPWIADFKNFTDSDKRRMVGWTMNDSDERSDPIRL
jgi:hypothetical protein